MEDALATARAALARGDLFGAYDAANGAIADGDASEDIRHIQALALARMGDTERALSLFRSYGLADSSDPHRRALGARLLKDQGLATGSADMLRAAHEAYRTIYDDSRDSYPGINAASLALLSGAGDEAKALARQILLLPRVANPADYYCAATGAEALVLLGDADGAAAAIRAALALPGAGPGSQAGTLRQLATIAPAAGLSPERIEELLTLLRPPASFHYAGHIFVPDPAEEARIVAGIEAILDARRAAYAYGSIAAGADILVAETVLRRGGELHLILPCAMPDFIAQSIRPAGEAWIPRAEACIAAATSVGHATRLEYVSPDVFGYGAAVAMGLARLRAQQLAAESFQLAIWDGKPGGEVGTGADVRLWRASGGETHVVDAGAVDRGFNRPQAGAEPPLPRRTAAILFTDYAGFSRLPESSYPVFDREVMGRVAGALERHEPRVLARNTWGDALYAVLEDAISGAEFAIDLQRVLAEFDPARIGLGDGQGGMRIALHYGSVYEAQDRVTQLSNFLGNEVARAARIEPVTPPGDVYVTEPFAAMVALHAPGRFHCRYVGQVDLAKKYGAFPMYRLTEANGSVEPRRRRR